MTKKEVEKQIKVLKDTISWFRKQIEYEVVLVTCG